MQAQADRSMRSARAVTADLSGGDRVPRVVAVVGPRGVGKSSIVRALVKHYTRHALGEVVGPVTVVTGKQKRITLVEVPPDLPSMIDAAKVCDLAVLVIDAHFGLEMETFEFLNIAAVHGMPRVMGVLTHLDKIRDGKRMSKTKKALKSRFWTEVHEGAKLFYLSGMRSNGEYLKREVLNLARFLSITKYRPISWRNEHAYVLADRVEDLTPADAPVGVGRTVAVYGFVRGAPLRVPVAMHMFGVGDLWVEQAEVRADPIPPPAAMADGDGKASKRRRSLSLKERQLHAPMSDFDGIAYDEDAAYIHVPDRSVRFSQTSKSSPDDDEDGDDDSVASDEEGVRMVRKLQRTSRSLAEQSSAWGLRLWRDSEAVRAPAESPGDADDRFRRPLEGTEAGVSVEVEDIGERRIRQARREHASRVAPAPSLQRVLYDDDASDDSGMEEEEKRTARVQPWGVAAGRDDVAGAGQPSEDDDAPGGLFRVRRAPVVDSLANAWSRDCSTVAAPITGSAAEDAQLRQRFAARAAFVEHYKGGTSDADEVVDVEARPPVPSDPTVNDGSDEDGDDEAWDDLSDAVEEESGESDAENDSSSAVMGGTDAEQVFDVDGGNDGDDSGSGDRDEEVEMTDGESNNHICKGARFVDAADRNQVRLETADGGASTQLSTSEANAVTGGADHYERERQAAQERQQRSEEQLSALDAPLRQELEGIRPGTYVRLVLRGVPAEFTRHYDPRRLVVLGALPAPLEQTLSFMRVRLLRHRWFRKVLKNRDPLIFSVGWRRFEAAPVLAMPDANGRERMIKYTPEHLHCDAVVYGPLASPGTGVVCFQTLGGERQRSFRVAATGVVKEVDAQFRIVKKLKLVGEPMRIFKNTAFVRGMFNSELEVAKFVGALLRTPSGLRGMVKKAVRDGPPGTFRATFEDRLLKSDIVFLRAWVPVQPPRYCVITANLLLPAASDTYRVMRTVREIRQAKQLPIPHRDDSMYRSVERAPRRFHPLRLPAKLTAALPFSAKPKDEQRSDGIRKRRARSHPGADERAVVMAPEERREHTFLQMLNALRHDREAKRKQAAKQKRVPIEAQRRADEERHRRNERERKKARYARQATRSQHRTSTPSSKRQRADESG
ncbi:hypothetical protein CDCA_CDCA17G4404 [Cyanidium caldarium]|uniref:Bms1-type G domain-containing protein n=1 Tax=Cyanidium caldarium TaxID=2771 RepID=A0AAV9J1L1_CYACA|nr:hypothetical protein CDCA_CDCA17G4404 [Cyanidium caldarium]